MSEEGARLSCSSFPAKRGGGLSVQALRTGEEIGTSPALTKELECPLSVWQEEEQNVGN